MVLERRKLKLDIRYRPKYIPLSYSRKIQTEKIYVSVRKTSDKIMYIYTYIQSCYGVRKKRRRKKKEAEKVGTLG